MTAIDVGVDLVVIVDDLSVDVDVDVDVVVIVDDLSVDVDVDVDLDDLWGDGAFSR